MSLRVTKQRGIKRRIPNIVPGKLRQPLVEREMSVLREPTSTVERMLLSASITVLPLQEHIPSLGGFSVMYLIFVALAGYCLVNRPRALAKIWLHPVFLSAYVWLGVSALIELSHPYSKLSEVLRIAQMIAGAVFMSSLIRDRKALQTCMYSFLVTGMVVSVLLFFTGYGDLQNATTANFGEATTIRNQAFSDAPIENSPNTLAFYTTQGAIVALALTLTAVSSTKRLWFSTCLLFCSIATFLPMSRGGIAILAVSCCVVMLAYGVTNMKTIILGGVALFAICIFVPEVVFSRLKLQTHYDNGKEEARTRIFHATVDHFPEYVFIGVGAGNFWGPWGERSGFAKRDRHVTGAHNSIMQVMVYWGLVGLLGLIAVILNAFRCLPKHYFNPLALSVLGIASSAVLFLQVHHVMSAKQFSLALGVVVGSKYWMWSRLPIRQTGM